MFTNSNNVVISGGTFAEVFTKSSSKCAMDRLLDAASLNALYNSGERFDPPKCHYNTRIAILNNLMNWFIGEHGRDMLGIWLYGPAGAGKSAIAQTLAEQCAAIDELLASFFFSRSDPSRNNARNFVATLAYQLSLRIPDFRSTIETTIDKDPAIFRLNFETQFRALILEPLLQLSSNGLLGSSKSVPSLVIIDGLDECSGPDIQRSILYTIGNAFQRHRSALPFKIFIASRPEHHLSALFSCSPLSDLTLHTSLDATSQAYEDIRVYLIDSFRDIRKNHIMKSQIPDSWPTQEDISTLVEKSSGQFIYAATVVRYVSSQKHHPLDRLNVIKGLRPAINDTPYAQLDALYMDILHNVEDVEEPLLVLAFSLLRLFDRELWETVPLGVENIEKIMQMSPGTVQLLFIDLLSVLDVSNSSSPIKYFHASFGDFLSDAERSHGFWINSAKIHQEISRRCIAYFSLRWKAGLAGQCIFHEEESTIKLVLVSLIHHLEQSNPLQENTALREAVLDMPFIQSLLSCTRDVQPRLDNPAFDSITCLIAKLFTFLKKSSFQDADELYFHHRGVWDKYMQRGLTLAPESPVLSFWSIVCIGMSLNCINRGKRHLRMNRGLLQYPHAWSDCSIYGPLILLSALPHVFNAKDLALGKVYIYDEYIKTVAQFLKDKSRAKSNFVNSSIYTQAAEFAVEFATRPYNEKNASLFDPKDWDFIWEALTFTLYKAGRSNKLVGLLSQPNLTFVLGKPIYTGRPCLRRAHMSISRYLEKCTGSVPLDLKISVDWTQLPEFANRVDDGLETKIIFCLDSSTYDNIEFEENKHTEDTNQEVLLLDRTSSKQAAVSGRMVEVCVRVRGYLRRMLLYRRTRL